ncbi:MAG: hypothetical protein J4F42_07000 [Desulfurellaceae bacterium]|nr:hypothetical protein [Desulfurellaceae bacterium]
MKIVWQVDSDDVAKVKAFYDKHCDNRLVQNRIRTNLADGKSAITKPVFWRCMVRCLLTTQQRSGPNSQVSRFIATNPPLLSYQICDEQDDLAEFARSAISRGGLRRSTIIGKELAANLSFLNKGGWKPTTQHLDKVRLNSSTKTERLAAERLAAEFIDRSFKGFGPKQSRNLLQILGLSRYEIPIDSRITKWLNEFGFPVELTAQALQDCNYYNFVSDGFQRLCEACKITPCVLDAVIFSSFDKGKWTKENVEDRG